MKNYKKDYKWTRFAHNKILENEDKIVDWDEANYSKKVWVDEFSDTDLPEAHL